jgi:hypothetical protein
MKRILLTLACLVLALPSGFGQFPSSHSFPTSAESRLHAPTPLDQPRSHVAALREFFVEVEESETDLDELLGSILPPLADPARRLRVDLAPHVGTEVAPAISPLRHSSRWRF